MSDFGMSAIDKVRTYAKAATQAHQTYTAQICDRFHIDVHTLLSRVLENPITINFHPDRLSVDGKTVLEGLMEQGQYRGQFQTGTTNGGKSAYIGGERFLWEQRLFFDAYPQNTLNRPKYGALNHLMLQNKKARPKTHRSAI